MPASSAINIRKFGSDLDLSLISAAHGNVKNKVISESQKPSAFGSYHVVGRGEMGEECTKEGIVTRNYDSFPVELQHENIFKYVRKGHVKTDEHWSRNWKRAPLKWELAKVK